MRRCDKPVPSIDIVCIDQVTPIEFPDLLFAVDAGPVPVSHRSPRPCFRRDLSSLIGCIYHLGNPECKLQGYDGMFLAYEVLSMESRHQRRHRFFQVAPRFDAHFRFLMRTLSEASPVHSLFFSTDWQFGPRRTTRGGVLPETEFWNRYDKHEIKLNAGYTILSESRI